MLTQQETNPNSLAFRIGRVLTPRFAIEGGVEVYALPIEARNDLTDSIEPTRASFLSAVNALFFLFATHWGMLIPAFVGVVYLLTELFPVLE